MRARDPSTDAQLQAAVARALRPGASMDAPARMRLGIADWLVLGGYPVAIAILVVLGLVGGWR